MLRIAFTPLALALIVSGCGSRAPAAAVDSRAPGVDASSPGTDAGPSVVDGTPGSDVSTPRPDVAVPVGDTGTPTTDTGGPVADKGVVIDAGPLGNSRCNGATTLTLAAGRANATGTTVGKTNEFASTINCGASTIKMPAPQAYYRIALTKGRSYKIRVGTSHNNARFYVFRSATCTATAINSDCSSRGSTGLLSDAIVAGGTGERTFRPTVTATYTIAIDAEGTAAGTYTLSVEEQIPVTGGSTCRTATAITLVKGTATVKGDTSKFSNEFGTSISCAIPRQTMVGNQAYYKLNLTAKKSYRFSVTPGFFLARAYVFRTGTCSASAINADCSSNGKTGAVSASLFTGRVGFLQFTAPTTGSYTVAIDTTNASQAGPFTLTVDEVVPVVNGKCAGATRLTMASGKVSIKGNTAGVPNEFGTAVRCGFRAQAAGQLYYKLSMTKGKSYSVSVSSSFSANFYVARTTCTATAISADCSSGGLNGDSGFSGAGFPQKIVFTPKTTADYLIVVDGSSASSFFEGAFTLDVAEVKIATNGTCKAAQSVTLKATGVTAITGDTTGLSNEFGTSINCGSAFSIFRGNQAYYKVRLLSTKTYTIDAAVSHSSGQLLIWQASAACDATKINTDCGSGGRTGLVSGRSFRGSNVRSMFKPATTGDYIISVDSTGSGASFIGTFRVEIQ